MKRVWPQAELTTTFAILPDELALVTHKMPASQPAFMAMLKYVQVEGRLPDHPRDVPPVVIIHLAQQLGVDPALSFHYEWQGHTLDLHRAQIRAFVGCRETTVEELEALTHWRARAHPKVMSLCG